MCPLGDRGGLCVAQHGSFNWEKPGLHFFFNVPYIPRAAKWPLVLCQLFARRVLGSMMRRCTASTLVSSSFEWHHFVDRSAQFTSSFRRHRGIVSAKKMRSAASLNLTEAYFTCEPFGSPLILLTVEGPRCPLGRARWICSATVLCGGMRLLP
jgi:hypothetical protein